MRTLLCLVSVTTSILVILCLANANPITGTDELMTTPSQHEAGNSTTSEEMFTSTASSPSVSPLLPSHPHINGSKLVITNVVKTIEFDVALEEDDDNSTENSAESSTPFIETDIKVLNPELLEEVVYELSSTHENLDKSIDGTKSSSEEAKEESST